MRTVCQYFENFHNLKNVSKSLNIENLKFFTNLKFENFNYLFLFFSATKTDLRSVVLNCVTTMEGEDMRFDIKASAFVECSALRDQGVKSAIHTTIRTIDTDDEKEKDCPLSKFCCCLPSYIRKFIKIR